MLHAGFIRNGRFGTASKIFALAFILLSAKGLDAVTESNARFDGHAELEQLKWLLGEWTHSGTEQTTRMNCRWSDDGNFLLVEYLMQSPDSEDRTATERIAWDPAEKKIRSWTFRSDGSFAESSWEAKDNQWRVRTRGVVPSGETVRGTIGWKLLEDGRLSVRSEGVAIGNEKLPDNELIFSRVGGDPADMPGQGNPAVEKIKWDLYEMNSVPMEFDRPLAIRLEGGKVDGLGPINRIGGSYSLNGNGLKFQRLMATEMGGPPELLDLETVFTQMLESVDSFQLDGTELLLMDGGQTIGRFRPGR